MRGRKTKPWRGRETSRKGNRQKQKNDARDMGAGDAEGMLQRVEWMAEKMRGSNDVDDGTTKRRRR